MGYVTPFQKDGLLKEMHRSIIDHIRRPSFSFTLPQLNAEAWKIICTDPRARERLEFLGDSLIGTQVSEGLIQHWPSEAPDFYTKCRIVLVANSTFAYLMWKAGICELDKSVKPAGDAFEAILALYHEKSGPANFKRYIHEAFRPLFKAVGESYYRNVDKFRKRKRQVQLHDRKLNQAAKSARELASSVYRRHDTPRSIKSALVNKKQRIYENQSPQKTPRKPTARLVPPHQRQPQPNVIDLTQGPHDVYRTEQRSFQGPDSSSDEDTRARRSAPNSPHPIAVKPEPLEPTLDNVPVAPTKESTHAPVVPHKPLQYPAFMSTQITDSQTQDILKAASKSQVESHQMQPPPLPKAPQAPPPPPSINVAGSRPPTMMHRRMPSGTADDLADMFASRATLAQVVPVTVLAPGHGTKEDPITILDDDD